MRWFVEISPLGASEGQKQKWCLEAAGWQPALKDARAHRGEEGPLGGFSIELLDDGARAVDPVTRIRYVIRSAPDDAPLTHTKDGPVKAAPAKTEPAKAAPASAKTEPAKAAPAPEPAKPAPAPEPAKPAPAPEPAKPAPAPEPAKPEASADDVDIPVDEDEATEAAPLPDYQVLQAREENPNERSPLTYREYVYAVAPSTPDSEIERLLHARFAAVTRDLADAKQGRFVNLAIFDHVFTGKPAKRPRATLAWKDWRGTPDIRFPAAERASLEPPSFAAPTSFSTPIPQPSILPPEPVSLVPSTSIAPTQPAPAAAAPVPAPAPATVVVPAGAAPASPEARISTLPTLPAISSAPATPVASTEPSREIAASDAATAKSEPSSALAEPKKEPVVEVKVEVKIEPPAEVKIEPAPAQPAPEAAPARPTAAPVSAAPKTKPAAAPASAPAPVPAKREAYIPAVKTAAQASKRMSGDELISELFEACGDLQFLRDSLEGADFVLSLALEKLPSEVGLVSLFDINRREFVVIRQAGGPRSIVLSRLPERAGLAQAAMRKKSAIVVPDASKEPRALDDRFRTLGIVLHSVMVAPVEVSGRYLGLIELCNPVDGKAFTEGDGHALTYIGEQYAEFVAERGVILDPEQVIDRHQKR